ncbi:CaiB/BaiF CoA transferase family protein [Pseudohongiella spirulinae]|uniref:L-carnitine dehydratase/bile acid-inducible protein F n=1 Tax=Pseudohongiella spirulinae TaxID=1249552 RepID=A0A0S2KF51_9GAMM|nr:CoA transferase [Pseudohongiella spirulinae]ALO46734.1 L-carnitine dehydratase/bile acid-inducible protein F [Pseudohongiella spirulinae]
MSKVLEGIRVLDFGRYIAGPFCASLLSDMGAEVIRIEKVDGSEDRFLSPVSESGDGALFMQMGRNKLGMTLNPMKPEGREIVRKLVATADVVVANLPPDTLSAMGLDYDSLRAVKPDIILTMISAFGTGGPYSNRTGFDGLGQAMSGAMYMSGTPEQPVKSYAPFIDFGTASLSAVGTMAALLERQKTGRGQVVEASLFNTALTMMNGTLIEQAMINRNRVATLNRSQTSGPADTFKTRDGWVLVQSVGGPLFERWVNLMGEPQWLEDPRFKDDINRGENGEIISARLAKWCAERSSAQVLAEMEAARIPAGPIMSPQQVLDDPHVAARQMLKPLAYPGAAQPAPVMVTPFSLSATPPAVEKRAPTLGEHTVSIMQSLGYSEADIAELKQKRVI